MHHRLATLAVILLALAAPPAAGATTFCVDGAPGCTAGTALTGSEVEAGALQGAVRSDGEPDLVWFAAGTFADANSWTPKGSDDLEIRGSGPATVLTSTSPTGVFVLNADAVPDLTVRDLTIRVPAGFPDGDGAAAQAYGDLFERVVLESRNVGADGGLFNGSTFRDGQVTEVEGGTVITAFRPGPVNDDEILVEGSTITANRAAAGESDVLVTVRDSVLRATGNSSALSSTSGRIVAENCVIFSRTVAPLAAHSVGTLGDASVRGDHLTIVNGDGGGYSPVKAQVYADGVGDATVILTNSIARGFPVGAVRHAPTASDRGDAGVAIRYSNLHLGGIPSSGNGTLALGPGLIDADPLYTGFLDYRLGPGSPSIDTGNPSATGPAFDLEGLVRVADGDGDGEARRDMGAYEVQPTPPATPVTDPPAGDPPTSGPPSGGTGPGNQPSGGETRPALAGFGAATNVTLRRVRRSRGRIVIAVHNRNAFAVSGRLAIGRRSVTLVIAAGATRRVRMRVPGRKRRVTVVATVEAPNGERRTVRRRVRLRG